MKKELELACNELGWGDPECGLWFVGFEEHDSWAIESKPGYRNVDELRATILDHYDHEEWFRLPEWDEDKAPEPKTKRYRVRETQAKICSALAAGTIDAWRDWYDWIWERGSKVAQGNLLPLPRENHYSWPTHYEDWFGVSSTNYRSQVDALRISKFRAARKALTPQAVVCFGVQEERLFADCLEIREHPFRELVSGKATFRIYDNERVLLTPFFKYSLIDGHRGILQIGELLRDWGVRIEMPPP